MDTVLLTGGSGFVGINISEILLGKGYGLVLLSRKKIQDDIRNHLETIGTFTEISADIMDTESIRRAIEENNVTHIIHAAAMTSLGKTEFPNMTRTVATNCVGTMNMLDAAHSANIKKFMYISSCGVYGAESQEREFISETDCPLSPRGTYDITKFAAEHLVKRYGELSGMPVCAVRIGDGYGPWERETEFRKNMSAPYQLVHYALHGEKALLPKPGHTAWAYVRDVAQAVVSLLECENRRYVYHACSIYPFSMLDFAQELSKYFPGFEAEVCDDPSLANVHFFSQKDNGLFDMEGVRADSGFVPEYNLEKAVADYVLWLKKNRR